MIGLAGWADAPSAGRDASVLERMLAPLAHRGAGAATELRGCLALGIVGRATGSSPRADDPVLVALDGRIAFDTPSAVDPSAETPERAIARAHTAWGEDFLRRSCGEFALALWDDRAGRLLLARDPVGVKPLYYCQRGSWLGFASEIKALLAHPRTPRELDRAALGEYMGYRYVGGAGTLFREIRELAPGERLLWERGRLTLDRYWDLPYEIESREAAGPAEYADRIALRLDEATRDALGAGDRAGVLLSGGLDSSLVTALAARRVSGLRTWSVGFADDRFDEGPRAELVARKLGTRHVNRRILPAEYAKALPEAIALNDEPLHHPNSPTLLLVARDAAADTGTLLMGEGADSSFGNRAALKLRLAETLRGAAPRGLLALACGGLAAAGLRRFGQLGELIADDADHFAVTSNLWTPAPRVVELLGLDGEEPILARRRGFFAGDPGRPPLARLLYYYQKTEMVSSFNVFGKMLTGAGIEPAMPFGDRRVQELSCRIPPRLKASLAGRAKPLIVRVCRRYLPDEVLRWRKMSFGFPIGEWLRRGGVLEPYVRLLLEPQARTREIFRPAALARVVAENERGVGNHGEGALWSAVNLELWMRIHLDGLAPAEVAAASRAAAPARS